MAIIVQSAAKLQKMLESQKRLRIEDVLNFLKEQTSSGVAQDIVYAWWISEAYPKKNAGTNRMSRHMVWVGIILFSRSEICYAYSRQTA